MEYVTRSLQATLRRHVPRIMLLVASGLCPLAANAIPIDLNFTFANQNDSIQGAFTGLDDAISSPQEAASLIISSNTLGIVPREVALDSQVFNNMFTFTAGELTDAKFVYNSINSTLFPLAVRYDLVSQPGSLFTFTERLIVFTPGFGQFVSSNYNGGSSLTPTPAQVPEPTPLALLSAGVLALGLVRRRKLGRSNNLI